MRMRMRIAVVGASGLVGRHVVAALGERGHRVTAVARTARPGVDHAIDATKASVPDWRRVLAGHDGVVFAAGADDREVPRRPAYPGFRRGNVEPVKRLLSAARDEGLTRAAVIGSYYTYFHRTHPDWGLADRHPYIRSRVEQAAAAREAAGPDLPVAVLELPFVFGRAGQRLPNWSGPLDRWVRSRMPLVAPVGGSAATSARRVGLVAADALDQASGADIPVAEENLTWAAMFTRIAAAAGHPRPVHRLGSPAVRAGLRLTGLVHTLTGRQAGLDPAHLAKLLLRELFLDPTVPASLDAAIAETFPPDAGHPVHGDRPKSR